MMSSSSVGFSLEGIDDVQDYPSANAGEGSSMSSEPYICCLMGMGNRAFRDSNLDQAIEFYSIANQIKPGDPVILSNRCVAYLRLNQFLIQRPPSVSEVRPLYGLDPTTHAGLALKDAEKVMNLESNSVLSYILKANALILLEKYDQAGKVICLGLQMDPQSTALRNLQRSTAANTFLKRSLKPQRTGCYDCNICLMLLYEPVTIPCGHSFCRSCLCRYMDKDDRCPLCRRDLLFDSRTCSISVTLNNIIQKHFPEEYEERKLEHENLANPGVNALPLYVKDVVLPCERLQLDVVECGYILMVRRIMEGNHRMAMDLYSSRISTARNACEVEITDCEPIPGGRFRIVVESRRRCRIIRRWIEEDGMYDIAEVEWIQDDLPPEGSTERNELLQTTYSAAVYVRQWMKAAVWAAQCDIIRIAELAKASLTMPPTEDPERFSFWLITLTNKPLQERFDLLERRNTQERINLGLIQLITEWENFPEQQNLE